MLQSVVTVTEQVEVYIQNEIHFINRLFLISHTLGWAEQEYKVALNAGYIHATQTVINIYKCQHSYALSMLKLAQWTEW